MKTYMAEGLKANRYVSISDVTKHIIESDRENKNVI